MDPKKCKQCGKSSPVVQFATLAHNNQPDTLCVRCRFDKIDNKHSSVKGIRNDMREADIPVGSGVWAKRLKTGRAASAEDAPADTQEIPEEEE